MPNRLILLLTLAASPAHALTELVGDVRTGAPSSSPQSFTVVNDGGGDKLYWLANGDDFVFGLWTLDETGSPLLVKDLRDPGPFSGGNRMVAFNDDFYFRGQAGGSGWELFRYSAADDELQLVWDLEPSGSSSPQYLTVYEDRLYFSAIVNGTGIELRSTDGTSHQTHDLWPGFSSSAPGPMAVYDGALWFAAFSPSTGNNHPCRFQGGAPFFYTDVDQAGEFTVWQDELYIIGKDDPSGRPKILKFDGTEFVVVADVDPTDTVALPARFLTPTNDGIYFTGDDGTHGKELWKLDGSGAAMVEDFFPGTDGIHPFDIAETTGGIVFSGFGADDEELYVYDGTSISLLADINETGDSAPDGVAWGMTAAVIDGIYYFSADDGINGRELWRTDGMSDATPVGSWQPSSGVAITGPLVMSAPRPNPTDAVATFTLASGIAGDARVRAFDVAGRRVANLFAGRVGTGSLVSVAWDMTDVAPGTYFVRLDGADGASATRRIVRMP